MQLSPWNPTELLDIQRTFLESANAFNTEIMTMSGFLATDIIQTNHGYRLYADVPGVKLKHLHLSVDNGVMTLSGERHLHYDTKDKEIPVLNRQSGKFSVSYTLSDHIAYDKITAKVEDGVLIVDMPVSKHGHPNQISIDIAQQCDN